MSDQKTNTRQIDRFVSVAIKIPERDNNNRPLIPTLSSSSHLSSSCLNCMEKMVSRRSVKPRSSSTTDDLTIVKAAAWAWYQRGCGKEGMVTNESGHFRARSTFTNPRPSRYRLEVLREGGRSSVETTVPLLDEYEIERITLQLTSLAVESGGNGKEEKGRRRLGVPATVKKAVVRMDGLWVRSVLGVCSSKEGDVLDGRMLVRRHGLVGGGGRRVAAEATAADVVV